MSPERTFPDRAAALLLAGPSCSGKDALLGRLLAGRPELAKPVTTTTRPPRPGEVDGVHYHFLDEPAFGRALAGGAFIEHATVHGWRFGLSRTALDAVRERGRLPVAILDVQGVASVRAIMPCLSVFVRVELPQLQARIQSLRPAGELDARMASARAEMAHAELFDHVIDNPDGMLDAASAELLRFYDHVAQAALLAYAGRRAGGPSQRHCRRSP